MSDENEQQGSEQAESSTNNEQQGELFPEYLPDYSDSTIWIEVRTPETITLGRVAGMTNDEGREVLSGRMLVSHRKRNPEDGSAEFVVEAPKPKPETYDPEPIYWPKFGEIVKSDPRVQRSTPSRGWSLGRNIGAMRADDSIE
jgi:hypothetical protein